MTLVDHFQRIALETPERAAIIEGSGRSISFGELESASRAMAQRLQAKGIGRGDAILVAVWPSIELYAGLAAIWQLGAIAVFPEPAMGIKGFRHAARMTRPKALLAPRMLQFISLLFQETRAIPLALSPNIPSEIPDSSRILADVALDDTALISFTTGTTGAPKAMARSHRLLMAQHSALRSLISTGKPEVDLVAFPAFALTCMGYGNTAVIPDWNLKRHDRVGAKEIHTQIVKHQVTRLLVPPSIVDTLATAKLPTSVSRVLTGGGPVYPDVIETFLATSPGIGLTVVYGSTEAEPISHLASETLTSADWLQAYRGGGLPVGHPVPEVRILLHDAEIIVTGEHVNKTYTDEARNAETKMTRDGEIWHRTGDRGRLDEDGRLWLLGRAIGPTGLHPFAIECAARSWPNVTEAVCVPDDSGHVTLFIVGNTSHLQAWREAARKLGDLEIMYVSAIPKDKRHRSKPDYAKLRQMSGRQ